MLDINPELLSQEPTHRHKGVLIKVFTTRADKEGGAFCLHTNRRIRTAEIMEGEHKGKSTSVYQDEMEELPRDEKTKE